MANTKITFCDYLAEQVPNASYQVLQDSGLDFPKPRSKRELSAMLKKFVSIDREVALKSLARIHPDRELLESLDREVKDADFKIKEASNKFGRSNFVYMNHCPACGFDGVAAKEEKGCKCKHSNFDGEKAKDYTPLLVTIGLFGLLYLMIDKKN
jgi:hypothetical protein